MTYFLLGALVMLYLVLLAIARVNKEDDLFSGTVIGGILGFIIGVLVMI